MDKLGTELSLLIPPKGRLGQFVGIFLLMISFIGCDGLADPIGGSAVLLIDMQADFLQFAERESIDMLVQNQLELLHQERKRGSAIVVFEYLGHGPTISPLREMALTYERVKFITKTQNGGFENFSPIDPDNPIHVLNQWSVDHLIVAGVNGAYCVKCTVAGALKAGFSVSTSAKVVATFSRKYVDIYPDGAWWQRLRKHALVRSSFKDGNWNGKFINWSNQCLINFL